MASSKTSPSKIAVWIIVGLLIVGLAGFGTGQFGGTIRTVGAVGDAEISTDEYYQALQGELGRLSQQSGRTVTLAEARQLGVEQQVLGRLLRTAAMDDEAARIGISAGDETVADQLRAMPAFQGNDGFDREAYAFALRNSGLNEQEFESEIRRTQARSLLQTAVAGGIASPDAYTDLLMGYIGERRNVTWAVLDESVLSEPVEAPDDKTLSAWYAENGSLFEIPTTRQITYAWLTPEALVGEVEVGEDAIRALYDERIDEYQAPERRLVERLVFGSEEDAQAAADAIAAGEQSFPEIVAARGLDLSDIDLGDVTEAELGEAGSAVFAIDGTGVAGPAPTPLGPALFRVNAVLAARDVAFEEVRDELRGEAAVGVARRAVADRAGPLDDELAAGVTIEELGDQPGVEVGTIDFTDGSDSGLAAYTAFREAAAAAEEGDFPELNVLEDGGVFAIRLDAVVEPRVPDLDEVREEATAAWIEAETRARVAEGAERLIGAIENAGGFEPFDLDARTEEGLSRDAALPGLPIGLAEAAFEMEEGELRVLAEDEVVILRLDAIVPSDPEGADTIALSAILGGQASQQIAQDVFDAFARAVQADRGIEVNAQALAAIQAQIP